MTYVDVHGIAVKIVDLFTATFAGVPAVDRPQVLDGRDYSEEIEPHCLVVGYSGNQSNPAYDVTRSLGSGSLEDTQFDVAVRGSISVYDGNEEFTQKRARAQATLAAMDAAVMADRSLGGSVYDAWLSPQTQWFQIADSEGNAVEVDWTLTVQVFA